MLRLLLLSVMLVLSLAAQSVRGFIGGRVTDPTGAPIPGVELTLVHVDSGSKRHARTDPSGQFMVPVLGPGAYRVEMSKAPYQTQVQMVMLGVNQEAELRVAMVPEGQRQQIDVSALAPMLKADSAVLGGHIQSQQIVDLPLDGRNYFELSLLLPGVSTPAQGSAGSVRGDFAMNVNGQREDANLFLLDGVYNGDPKLNGVGVTSPVDGIREFEVATGNYDASFGRNAGGQVNVVLKSGTNQIHGTAYEFFRNAALDARNFFSPAGEPDPRYQRNQYGFSLGGPLKKDRTFLFGDWEGRRVREGIPQRTTVPTLEERAGDFSKTLPYVIDPFTQAPFPGNRIPATRIHPVGQNLTNLYPLPNRTGANNYAAAPVGRDKSDNFDIRLDQKIGQRSDLSARYSFADRLLYEPFGGRGFSQVPGYGNDVPRRAHNAMIGETHVFTPALLNELRLGFNRVDIAVNPQNQATSLNSQVGLPTIWGNPRDNGLSFTTVRGYSSLGEEYNNPQASVTNSYQIVDQATWTRGRHLVKFGGEIRRLQQNAFRDVQSRGLLNFTGFTGNGLTDMLQGLVSASAFARLDNPQHLRSQSYSLFAQDTWRVRSDFTLTAGMRWEYTTPAVDPQNRATLYDPATAALIPVGSGGLPRAGYNSDYNNFGPRVGFAWSPRAGSTVLRGGYGVYFDQSSLAPSEGLYFSPPYYDFQFRFFLPQMPLTLSDPFPANFPVPYPPSAFAFQRDLRTPYSQHWNFNVQQALGRSRTVEVGYVGTRGNRLIRARDLNQPYAASASPLNLRPDPRFGDITYLESAANSAYHSLQATFTQRLTGGLSLLTAYTWGRSIDDASGFFPAAGDANFPQNSYDLRAERGRSNFDATQRLVASYTWMIPGAKRNWLLGGWQTNGIWTLQTGRPFTVALPTDEDNSNTGRASLGFGANDRPSVVGTARLDTRTPERWFNTSAFVKPPFGSFGNAGRNIVEGPGLSSLNLSLFKNFALRESLTLQFRAEAFNALNRTNFNQPENFLGAAGFGTITSAQNPRLLQLGLKLIF